MIAVIFEVIPKANKKDQYFDIASELKLNLMEINGFVSIERFQSMADPSKFLSLSFWKDEAAVTAWRTKTCHREAQHKGRDLIFNNYRIRVAQVLRDYGLNDRAQVLKN